LNVRKELGIPLKSRKYNQPTSSSQAKTLKTRGSSLVQLVKSGKNNSHLAKSPSKSPAKSQTLVHKMSKFSYVPTPVINLFAAAKTNNKKNTPVVRFKFCAKGNPAPHLTLVSPHEPIFKANEGLGFSQSTKNTRPTVEEFNAYSSPSRRLGRNLSIVA